MDETGEWTDRAVVLLVHGIGPFDAVRQEGAARSVIARALPGTAVEVQSFDWRSEVGGAIRRTRLDAKALGSLGLSWYSIALDRLLPETRSPGSRRFAASVITLYHFTAVLLPFLLTALWIAGSAGLNQAKPQPGEGLAKIKTELQRATRMIETHHQGRPLPPVLLDPRHLRKPPDEPALRPWTRSRYALTLLTALLFAIGAAMQLPRRGGSMAGRCVGLAAPWIWSVMLSLLILPYLVVQASRRSEVKSQGLLLGIVGGGALFSIASSTNRETLQPWLFVAAICAVPVGVFAGPRLVRWAAGRALRLLQTPVGLALMLIADVVRYLGDATYRRQLQDHLGERLQKLLTGQPRDLVLAAHSLGSAIAVDTLRRRDQPVPKETRVTLLTMGSPLRRTFHRFFPDRYPDPLALRTDLDARVGPLRWINVHRPFDPVGTDLLGSLPADRVAGKMRWYWPLVGFFPAHTDYWGDATVLDQALQGIRALPFGAPALPGLPVTPTTEPKPLGGNDARAMVSLLLSVGLGIAAGIGVWRAYFAGIGGPKVLLVAITMTFAGLLWLYLWSPYFGIALGYIPEQRQETRIEIRRSADVVPPEPPETPP